MTVFICMFAYFLTIFFLRALWFILLARSLTLAPYFQDGGGKVYPELRIIKIQLVTIARTLIVLNYNKKIAQNHPWCKTYLNFKELSQYIRMMVGRLVSTNKWPHNYIRTYVNCLLLIPLACILFYIQIILLLPCLILFANRFSCSPLVLTLNFIKLKPWDVNWFFSTKPVSRLLKKLRN